MVAALLALGSNACGPGKKKLVLPPAPHVVASKPLPEAKIEAPPEIETPVPIVEIPLPEIKVEPPPKPVPPPKPAPPAPTAQTTPAEVQPAAPAPTAQPGTVPRLGEILTDDRRKEYEAEFTGFVTGARAAVDRATGRRLTSVQRETVGRIRVFLQQAEALRAKDLATARELARRADLLGKDLLNSLR